MKKTILKLLCLLLLIACSKDKDNTRDLSYDNFDQSLTPEMSYEEMVGTFGKPAKDIGSGIHIYVYELDDSTEIWIGYTDKIIYAKHMDQNQNMLEFMFGVHYDTLSYEYFQYNLYAYMDYAMLVETFGEPDDELGSGIHIYVYVLEDSTEIWIGYTDQILYARHMDVNNELIEELIN